MNTSTPEPPRTPERLFHKPPVSKPTSVSGAQSDLYLLASLQNWYTLDTETASFKGDVIEVALLDPEGELVVDTYVHTDQQIEAGATEVHGITNEDLNGSPSWPEVWKQITDAVDGPVVIYNAEFDLGRLDHMAEKYGLDPVHEEWDVACAMLLTACACGEWDDHWGWYGFIALEEIARMRGVEDVDQDHRAACDCRLTRKVVSTFTTHPAESEEDDGATKHGHNSE